METATTTVLVDGQLQELNLDGSVPFPVLMQAIKTSMDKPEMAITCVKLNGEDITGKDWERFSDLRLEHIRNLEVETGDLEQLARETLGSLGEFITDLLRELKRTAGLFRLGDYAQGGEVFSQTLDGVQLVNHTTAMVERNLGIETRLESNTGNSFSNHFINLEPILEDMFNAQRNNDWILLADLLEYEFIPYFEDRLKIINSWAEKACA